MNSDNVVKILISDVLTDELLNKVIRTTKFPENAFVYADQFRYMMFCDKYLTDCFNVVATDNNDDVCGYLYCVRNDNDKTLWYYGDLFVIPNLRRRGIAEQMLKSAMFHLSEIGAKRLRCYVESSNAASICLQHSLGFMEKPYEKFNEFENEGQIMFETELPTHFSVAIASAGDAKFIAALYAENKELLHGTEITFQEFKECLSIVDEDELNLLVCKGSMPVAWLKLNGLQSKTTAWLSMLVVHNKFRRQGIGKFSVEYAEQYSGENGFSELKIHTTEDNVTARALYARLGYTVEGGKDTVYNDGENGLQLTFVKSL